ncbi:MAG: hypothetical protein ACI8YQ_003539 [Polaribacter sp.]|jgi:hypothetical protein
MKKKMFKIITILIGLAIGLLLGEIVSRVYIFGTDGLSFKKVNSVKKIGESGYVKVSSNSKVLYELKPNIDDVFKLKEFKTNTYGFRDKAITIVKPKNTVRGVIVGDSFTMGSGVDIEDTYHSKIEKELNQRSDSVHYELLNFGVPGYNLLNYVGVMEEKVMQYNPDFLIIGFCSRNDFKLPNKQHTKGNHKVKETSNPFFISYLNKLIESTVNRKLYEELNINNRQKEFIDQMFNTYATFSYENNIPIILTYLSTEQDHHNLDIIQSLAIKNNLPFAHSKGKFNYEKPASYQVNIFDAHPNELGHQIFANSLLSFQPFLDIIIPKKGER